jgi:hypothetical protein
LLLLSHELLERFQLHEKRAVELGRRILKQLGALRGNLKGGFPRQISQPGFAQMETGPTGSISDVSGSRAREKKIPLLFRQFEVVGDSRSKIALVVRLTVRE